MNSSIDDSSEKQCDYDVALSFAGEDRHLAEQLASLLGEKGIRVFYDRYEQAALWGKDLYQHLQTIYRDRAHFCVILISRNYAEKLWTRHELRQAQARAFAENREYILPIRIDDSEIPGVNATLGYIRLADFPLSAIVTMLVEKIDDTLDEDVYRKTWDGKMIEFRGQEVVSYWPSVLRLAQSKDLYTFELPRIRWGDETRYEEEGSTRESIFEQPCGDCGALKGELHVESCDIEECPLCHNQALSCDCIKRYSRY